MNVIACRKPKKEQDTKTMLSGSVMAILSMLVKQISEIHQKPTLLGSDPQNTSSCSTLDKIAIIEGMPVLPMSSYEIRINNLWETTCRSIHGAI
jgi:hypothetical protein